MERYANQLKNNPKLQFPKIIDSKLGSSIGLLKVDLVESRFRKPGGSYYNVPSVSLSAAEATVARVISEREISDISQLDTSFDTVSSTRDAVELKKRKTEVMLIAEEEAEREAVATKKRNAEVNLVFQMPSSSRKFHNKTVRDHNKLRHALEAANDAKDARIRELELLIDSLRLEQQNATEEKAGGLTRQNICSREWHEKNPTASKDLFGFKNYPEMLEYITCFWPKYFDRTTLLADGNLSEGEDVFSPRRLDGDPITVLEKCLIAKMRMHRKVTINNLSFIWVKSRQSIGTYIYEWVPKWGYMGLQLSLLDIPPFFLEKAMPDEFKKAGMSKCGALVDGKVIMSNECRQHSAIKRAAWSDKVHHAGFLFHAWIIPCGLNFEHTGLYLARLTESALVKLYGTITRRAPCH